MTSRNLMIRFRLLFAASSALLGFSAAAQNNGSALNPILDDRFTLRLGAYFEKVDSAVAKFNPDIDVDTKIDLERAGLDDDDTSLVVQGRWRFAERWQTNFGYYGTDRSGSTTAEGDIEFGDLIIPARGKVDSRFSADIYAVDIGYSIVKTPRSEFGLRLGLHAVDLAVELKGSGTIGESDFELGSASSDTLAPLLNIGLFGTYAFNPKLSVSASLGYFSLDYDKYDGEIAFAEANADYRITDTLGVGLGYSFLDLSLDVDEPILDERYEFDYRGPVLYLSAGF